MRSLAVNGYTADAVAAALTASGRTVEFVYDVVSAGGDTIGRLDGVETCVVENNALARNVKRTAKIGLRDLGGLDLTSDRIRPRFRLRMPDEVVQVSRDDGPVPYDEVVLADGPVGYWRLGEASGAAVAVDASGNGRDGTYVGSTRVIADGAIAGDTDTASRFAIMDAADPALGVTSSPYTYEIWLRRTDPTFVPNNHYCLSTTVDGTWDATIRMSGNGFGGWHKQADGNFRLVSSPTVDLDVWHHLVLTWEADLVRFYVDGAEVGNLSAVGSWSSGRTFQRVTASSGIASHGSRPSGTTNPIEIDEAAVYARALTAAEVAEHYAAGRGRLRNYQTVPVVERRYAEWPLGLFVLSSPDRTVDEAGTTRQIECYDLGVILLEDRTLDRYVIPSGTVYTTAIADLLDTAGIVNRYVTVSDATLPAARDWPPGTPRGEIVDDLLRSINYGTLWFDGDGFAIARPYQPPSDRPTGHEYATDDRSVVEPAATVGFDLFTVPNAWVATVSEADRPPLRSTYTNDNPSSPTSTVSRGRTIVDHRTVDVATQAALDGYVARIAFEASQVLEVVEFATAVMPHHEDGDVLRIRYPAAGLFGRYTEHTWALECAVGGRMTHRVRRVVDV